MTGMASLVEFQDFNLNHLPPHHSVMMPTIPEMQTLEEIMAQDVSVEPLPTPPLSPDHDICCPSPSSESSSRDHDLDSGDGLEIMAEALLNEMMSYEQLFAEAMDGESSIAGASAQGSSFSLEGHFLVQDCMWNSHTYQPRNTIGLGVDGVYTPAPSPTTPQVPSADQNNQEEGEEEEGEGEDASTPRNDASSDSSSASDQTDCISPNDVFPTCMVMPTLNTEEEDEDAAVGEPTTATKKVKVQPVRHTRQERARRAMEREQRSTRGGGTSSIMTRRASANPNGNSRIQPQASASSESEEEIDVVTVSERPERTLTRSRRRPSSSASAPCSRHTSPSPSLPPTKKRRYHAKRLQRIRSTGEDITESDDEQRRASHNILERKRRNDLKYSFQLLREQVPELEDNQRAPKVIILRKAAEFIKYIREREEKLEQEYEREKKREAKLQQKLEYLKTMPMFC